MGMSIDEAIRHLGTYSSTMGSGQTTQEQHEDAKRVAIETMRKYEKIDEAITRYKDTAEYLRILGNLKGCIECRQIAEWLEKLQKI